MNQVAYSKQQGFLLITVVVILVILASIAMLLSTSTSMDNAVLSRHTEHAELDYVAEAGLQHSLWLARQANCSNYANLTDQAFGDHSYSVKITPIDGSPVTMLSTAALDSGASKMIQRSAATVYSATSTKTVVFQPGSEGHDAEIWNQKPDDNYGDGNETWVSSATDDTTRSLLRFDLGAIPANAIILEATLFLTRQSGSGSDQPVSAHRIMNSWSEDSVSWNLREVATNWDEAGSDFDKNAVATTPVGPSKERHDWNITPLAQGWVDGSYTNYGVVLVAAIDGMEGERFYTSDESDPNKHPGLSVSYVCECGQTCTKSGGSSKNVLLVVGDPAGLTPEQADKKALMEGWGHTVTLIATGELQAAFDSAAALVDVVYIPELGFVPMSELGTKADDLAVGVITEEARTTVKLGSFTLLPFVDTTSINIINNTHYMTEALPTGNVVLSTATQSFWKLAGTLAPDLHILGELSGSVPGLAYVDVGETVNDSGPAAGRRVKLPWGSYDFDVNLLTPEALDIMERAIEWGAGASGGGACAVTVLDAFNAESYSGSDADPLWVGDWVEFGDSGIPSTEDERVIADTTGFKLQIGDNDNGGFGGNGEGVWREIDLSGMSAAKLSFKFQRSTLEDANDAAILFVSGDGGTSWSPELWRTEGPGSDPAFQQADIDISAYVASNTRIRFQTGTGNGGGDKIFFDDVTVCAN